MRLTVVSLSCWRSVGHVLRSVLHHMQHGQSLNTTQIMTSLHAHCLHCTDLQLHRCARHAIRIFAWKPLKVNLTRETKLMFHTSGWLNDRIQKLTHMFQFTHENNAGNILPYYEVWMWLKPLVWRIFQILYSIKYLILIGQYMQSE